MKESSNYIVETCTDNPHSCFEAVAGGADRIELCAALAIGGITPSHSFIRFAKERLDAAIAVMIRPRGGDFLYDKEEFELMEADVDYCREVGVDSVVLGLLTKEGKVDTERTKRLVERAKGMSVCFHRAVDMSCDIMQAMQDIIDCGCQRVLSSGGAADAPSGFATIRKMQEEFSNRIDIMVGGGVNHANAPMFREIGIRNFHLSGKVSRESAMQFRKQGISMGATSPEKEYLIDFTDQSKIRTLRNALEKGNL